MATLITHLRTANPFLDIIPNLSPAAFVMGSIAPDCEAPPQISHWTPTGEKDGIRSQDFFDAYLKNATNETAEDKKSFYLGYYIHLFADKAWWEHVWLPTSVRFCKEIEKDRGFIKEIKKSWHYADCLFLRGNKDLNAFRILEKIKSSPNIFIDCRPENAFDFTPYISPAKVSVIINAIIAEIRDDLSKNNIII